VRYKVVDGYNASPASEIVTLSTTDVNGTQTAPTKKSTVNTTITLETEANANGATVEYSNDGGTTWQDSTDTKDTEYTFVARYKTAGGFDTSPISEDVKISTTSKSSSSGFSGRTHNSSSKSNTTTSATTVSTPSIADSSASGWTAIASKLDTSIECSSTEIDLDSVTTVPADVIRAIAR